MVGASVVGAAVAAAVGAAVTGDVGDSQIFWAWARNEPLEVPTDAL